MASKQHPYGLSIDLRAYLCSLCSTEIPDGCRVLAKYSAKGNLTGVKVEDFDGNVRHECGTKITENGEV